MAPVGREIKTQKGSYIESLEIDTGDLIDAIDFDIKRHILDAQAKLLQKQLEEAMMPYYHNIDGPAMFIHMSTSYHDTTSYGDSRKMQMQGVTSSVPQWYLYNHKIEPAEHGIQMLDTEPWFATPTDQMMWLQLAERLKPLD